MSQIKFVRAVLRQPLFKYTVSNSDHTVFCFVYKLGRDSHQLNITVPNGYDEPIKWACTSSSNGTEKEVVLIQPLQAVLDDITQTYEEAVTSLIR